MKKEIVVGVVVGIVVALITSFLGYMFFGVKKRLSEYESQELARNLKTDTDFTEILINKFEKDERFHGRDGVDGKDGVGIGDVMQKGNNSCMDLGKTHQFCWGSEKLTIPTDNKHVRNFNFKFSNKFSEIPVVTTGIHSNYPENNDAFGVYHYSLSKDSYFGTIVEFDKNESPSPVVMQYFAIGSK